MKPRCSKAAWQMRAMSLQGVDDVRENGLSTRQGTTADKQASSMKVMSEIQAAWHGMSSGAWGCSAIPGGSLSSANTSPPGCLNWITQPAKTAAHGCDRATEKDVPQPDSPMTRKAWPRLRNPPLAGLSPGGRRKQSSLHIYRSTSPRLWHSQHALLFSLRLDAAVQPKASVRIPPCRIRSRSTSMIITFGLGSSQSVSLSDTLL